MYHQHKHQGGSFDDERSHRKILNHQAMIVGGLVGVLTCAIGRLVTHWYSQSILPSDADMGERFAVGMTVLPYLIGLFFISVVGTVIMVGVVFHHPRSWHPPSSTWMYGGGIVTAGVLGWVVLSSPDRLLDGGLMSVWIGIHALLARTRGHP